MKKAFFAYRLPGEKKAVFLQGDIQFRSDYQFSGNPTIIIHSFSSDQQLTLENIEKISEQDFIVHDDQSANHYHITSSSEYVTQFANIMQAIQQNKIRKAVLSRIKKMPLTKKVTEIFSALNDTYPNTWNYIFSSAQHGTWLGASPELLLNINDREIETVSLAGTKSIHSNQIWTEKEFEEQQVVTDFIKDVLIKNQIEQIEISTRQTIQAGPVEHLKTILTGKINTQNQITSLLRDLHPTPATCGLPKLTALELIQNTELHDREFYTGFIGILGNTSSTFFINLRCMKISQQHAFLFVGGGITAQSNAESEWNETEKKAETLSRFL
ncbi:MAG: chorismate-binding protein [Crocinitomicaceae bacterium]|nr:chorismate-binding protein [Crocinitomicaceae bacterium]MBK8924411.1 chorismate-binding protein [Crocinitomicaceae bacterium]